MENISLLNLQDEQDNTSNKEQSKGLLRFVIIQRPNRQVKIPCANEIIAQRLLVSYTNNNSNCKISLM